MSFRIAGGGDVEGEVPADVADEVGRVAEATIYGNEIGLAPRRISTESYEIFDARLLQSGEDTVNLFPGLADAGEVGHGQNVGLSRN